MYTLAEQDYRLDPGDSLLLKLTYHMAVSD